MLPSLLCDGFFQAFCLGRTDSTMPNLMRIILLCVVLSGSACAIKGYLVHSLPMQLFGVALIAEAALLAIFRNGRIRKG